MKLIEERIRIIPDFPIPGIQFRDITPVLSDPRAMGACIEALAQPFREAGITAVAGMEARGFIFGSLVASALDVGFVPLRKPGKLPAEVVRVDYALEYGQAGLEVHRDALSTSSRVLVVDDLLATGGTARAACELLGQLGASVIACAFLIELSALGGRERLDPVPLHTVLRY